MDLHRRRSVLVRMTEDGRKLETVRIGDSPAALRKEIAKAGKNLRVVLEATYGWYWAADVLEAAGAEVYLAHPLGVKAYSYRRVKNDPLTELPGGPAADGTAAGSLDRPGGDPGADPLPHKLVKLRTSVKDQVHGVLAKLGIGVPSQHLAGRAGPAAAVYGQGRLAAAARGNADRRDHPVGQGPRRPAGRA